MIGPGTCVGVYLACGITDMRNGIEDLAACRKGSSMPCGARPYAARLSRVGYASGIKVTEHALRNPKKSRLSADTQIRERVSDLLERGLKRRSGW
jgi:hypothetical protein